MTNWLIRIFIRDPENTSHPEVRAAYGTLAGLTGIFCNLLLFAVKLLFGILSGSSAVLSDAVNNLSDCIACAVTVIGSRIASRPADAEHPFGHGRLEYVVSLLVTGIIFTAAFELIRESTGRILNPVTLNIPPIMIPVLIATVLVKLWMSGFNRSIGNKLDHTGLLAAARDSLNDVLTSSLTILSLFFSARFPGVPIDGIAGALLALYVIVSAFSLAREILAKLLGEEPDPETVQRIQEILTGDPEVFGIHDVIIHDYGPGNRLGSAHAELAGDLTLREVHAIIDSLEKEVYRQFHIVLVIHPDPRETDQETEYWRTVLNQTAAEEGTGLSLHDLHLQEEGGITVLIFDVDVPYACRKSDIELLNLFNKAVIQTGKNARCRITFERGYTSHELD